MARNQVNVTVDTARLDRLIRQLPGAVDDNIRAIAFAIEAKAKAKAPVDTGALRASIYTRTARDNGYAQASADARQRNADAALQPLPEPGEHAAVVGPSVGYALDVELGTARRAATPYLTPAVREVGNDLARRLGQAVEDAAR